MNAKRRAVVLVLMALAALSFGCVELLCLLPLDGASVKLILMNDSASRYVAPNPGLCPQGLDAGGHSFLPTRPVIAPGQSVTYSTFEIGGLSGLCSSADPTFMVGLCGWHHGEDPNNLAQCSQRYGGQIGFQFSCGDTVILRWTDEGGVDGVWTSDVQPAAGNPMPTMSFQSMDSGGMCTG